VIARLGSDGELRWAQEVYIGSGGTSLVQSRCSCYPLCVKFAVGITNGQERERAPKSLCCVGVLLLCVKATEQGMFFSLPPNGSQALPFIAQGKSSRLHGRKRRKKKRKAEEYKGGSLHSGAVLLLWVGPASLVIENGGTPLLRRSTAVVATVACSPPWRQ
jgi:hypothetical protein